MGCVDTKLLSSLLLLPADLIVEAVYPGKTHLAPGGKPTSECCLSPLPAILRTD